MPSTCRVSRLRWLITLSMITWISRGLARLNSCTTKEATSTCSRMPRWRCNAGQNQAKLKRCSGVLLLRSTSNTSIPSG